MKISSKKIREIPSNGLVRQAMGKGFGIKSCQSVFRDWKRSQILPKNDTIVVWENPYPNHKGVATTRVFTHCHLR
jgi:hypothetical protein